MVRPWSSQDLDVPSSQWPFARATELAATTGRLAATTGRRASPMWTNPPDFSHTTPDFSHTTPLPTQAHSPSLHARPSYSRSASPSLAPDALLPTPSPYSPLRAFVADRAMLQAGSVQNTGSVPSTGSAALPAAAKPSLRAPQSAPQSSHAHAHLIKVDTFAGAKVTPL